MKKLILMVLVLLSSCFKDLDQSIPTPLILCFPSGKTWEVEELMIGGINKTGLISTTRIWFYNPIGSDPNAGPVLAGSVYGTWKVETGNSNEYLLIFFDRSTRISIINGKWEIISKWSNRFQMRDNFGNFLIIRID
jgi:hypothetical protein